MVGHWDRRDRVIADIARDRKNEALIGIFWAVD
jgi:hypothetical protein